MKRKLLTLGVLFIFLASAGSALTLEEGLNQTNQHLDKLVSSYEKGMENGKVVDQGKYKESREYFNKTLDLYYNISSKIKEVAPAEYKEGNLALKTLKYYINHKKSSIKVRTLVRVFKGEATEIIYMSKHGGEEPPEQKAEGVGNINLEKAGKTINKTREKLKSAVRLYKDSYENEEIVNQDKYEKSLEAISEAIRTFKGNKSLITVTERSESEYDEAVSALYTAQYFIESKKTEKELEEAESLFTEEETVEVYNILKKNKKVERKNKGISLGVAAVVIGILIAGSLAFLYMRKEKII